MTTVMAEPSYRARFTAFLKSKWHLYPKFLVWAAGLAFLLYCTTRNCLPLLSEYQHNNAATQITVIKNEPTPKPDMALCLQYPNRALVTIADWLTGNESVPISKCLECQAMQDHGWNVWKNNSRPYSNATAVEYQLVTSIMQKLLENERNMNQTLLFNQSNFNWNEAIFHAVWRFFLCKGIQDIKMAQFEKRLPNICGDTLKNPLISSVSRETMDFLFRHSLEYLAMYLKIRVTYESDMHTEPDDLMNRQSSFAIKLDRFCLAMRSDQDIFREQFTYIPFNEKVPPPWKRSERSENFLIFQDHTTLYDTTKEYAAVYPIGRRTLLKGFEQAVLAYSVEARVIETRPNVVCDNASISPGICLVKRQLKKAIEYCRCVPFIYRNIHAGTKRLPYCNHSMYDRCQTKLHENLELQKQECANKCTHTFYAWRPVGNAHSTDDDEWEQTFRIDINYMPIPFVEFRITTKETLEQFTAQIGGVVNLYLGFSGVSICALIVFCMEWLREWYRSKQSDGSGAVSQIRIPEDGSALAQSTYDKEDSGFSEQKCVCRTEKIQHNDEIKVSL